MRKSRKESQYIREVLDYESQYGAKNSGNNGCPPIMAKLLLSIFIRLGDLLVVLSLLLGTVIIGIFN